MPRVAHVECNRRVHRRAIYDVTQRRPMRRVTNRAEGKVGLLPSDLRTVLQGGSEEEVGDLERVLCERRLPAEVCNTASERPASRKAAAGREAHAAAGAELWTGEAFATRGVGSGWISLVGSAGSATADLDAVAWQPH